MEHGIHSSLKLQPTKENKKLSPSQIKIYPKEKVGMISSTQSNIGLMNTMLIMRTNTVVTNAMA